MKKKFKIKRIVIIAVLVYFVYTLILQQKTLNAYRSEEKHYTEQLVEAQEKNQSLLSLKTNLNSTDYITEIAREKLGMYLPNERVYIDISK